MTGASRGVGRGIAEVLGECGATTYVTARSDAIDDVATSIGGVAVRCDHGNDDQVEKLFDRIRAEQGHLDLLVSNAVGWGDMTGEANADALAPVWEKRVEWWDANFSVGVRSHFVTCRYALPLMLDAGGLIVFTSEFPEERTGRVDLVLNLRAHATARMAMVVAKQHRSFGVACVVVVPGFPRTEGIIQAFENRTAHFADWSEQDFLANTESVHYSGRAVASLVADSAVMERSGSVLRVVDLAKSYGFTDIDGRRPEPVGGA